MLQAREALMSADGVSRRDVVISAFRKIPQHTRPSVANSVAFIVSGEGNDIKRLTSYKCLTQVEGIVLWRIKFLKV